MWGLPTIPSKTGIEEKVNYKRKVHVPKGRSAQTHANKLRELKKFYNNTFKNSQEVKKNSKNKTKKHFCDKYPDWKTYLDSVNIKKVNQK